MSAPYQVLPPLDVWAFAALKAAILDWGGVRDPVVLTEEGEVLDGHNRIAAWTELRAEGHALPPYPTVVRAGLAGDVEKRTEARGLNLARRQLSRTERAAVIEAQVQETPGDSDRCIGARLGVHHGRVAEARRRLVKQGHVFVSPTSLDADGKRSPRTGGAAHGGAASAPPKRGRAAKGAPRPTVEELAFARPSADAYRSYGSSPEALREFRALCNQAAIRLHPPDVLLGLIEVAEPGRGQPPEGWRVTIRALAEWLARFEALLREAGRG